MPKFPNLANRISRISGSVFEKFRAKMNLQGENLVRLHIGDTYLHPQYPLQVHPVFLKNNPGFNRYCSTFGVEELREVLTEKVNTDNGFSVDPTNILITNGATNALSVSVQTLLNPDDEILLLTPCWPFFSGMVKMVNAKIVEVPLYVDLYSNSEFDIAQYLESYLTSRTAAVYLNTPNNPSGKVLNRDQLQKVGDFCRKHLLWIISDEAYDGLTFDGRRHISVGTLPDMFPQTISIFTFSKSFMFAGLRLGYLVADKLVVKNLNKVMVHQLYSPSTLAQQLMVEPVRQRKNWIPQLARKYQQLRDLCIENLQLEVNKPEATYFFFFSIEKYLRGRDYWHLVDLLFEAGVSIAPGIDFGSDFQYYIRVCFTGEPEERLWKGIERINRILLNNS